MKKLIYLIFIACIAVACNDSTTTQNNTTPKASEPIQAKVETGQIETYGEKITEEGAIAASQIPAMLEEQDSATTKVFGVIDQCCQKKGCWIRVPVSDEQTMMVRFKDYGFFVPMDSEGKEIIIEGKVKKEVIPVAMLKHYAEDAGKSQKEIDAIQEDKVEISFEANGVIIKG